MSEFEEPEDDMLSEEEQEEADREFLTPIFFLTITDISAKPPSYDIYTQGDFGQQHIDRLNKRFKILIIEPHGHGLHIGLKRWQEIPRK